MMECHEGYLHAVLLGLRNYFLTHGGFGLVIKYLHRGDRRSGDLNASVVVAVIYLLFPKS